MACAYPHPASDDLLMPIDNPAVVYVVARRVELPSPRVLYYVDAQHGWVTSLADATDFYVPASAALIAANFSGAVVVRVMVWPPLPRLANPDDLPKV
jgi:hypothetical protein